MLKISVVVCSKGREQELNRLLTSLQRFQTYRNFETIVIDKDAPLSYCRDMGWRMASGKIVVFIDDDVDTPPNWLYNIIYAFKTIKDVAGVTGPTIVPETYLQNRDVFKYKSLYQLFNKSEKPGYISLWGAPSMFSNFCRDYFGEVDYLECCNMALRRDVIEKAGGFDLGYEKTSEWCEVDLSMRCRQYGRLLFVPQCWLFHLPSQQGAYSDRLDTSHRYRNFVRFSDRHLPKTWQLKAYKFLYKTYLKWKERMK